MLKLCPGLPRRVAALAVVAAVSAATARFSASAEASEISELSEVSESSDVLVYLDGRELEFADARPQLINNSVMVPLRAIGEEMGATVSWEGNAGVAELTLGGRFARLTVNSAVMSCGMFEGFGDDRAEYDVEIYELASPAVLADNHVLVPLRAISEGMGGSVEWLPDTRAALIASPGGAAEPAPVPTPPPSPTPSPAADALGDTPWFENITPERAQSMYDNNEKFVLVYYSGDANSRLLVPIIKAAGRDSGVKAYAVDSRARGQGSLDFIWRLVDEGEASYPVVFRVLDKTQVGVTQEPRNQETLTGLFTLFSQNIMDDPSQAWGTPTPTPPGLAPEEDFAFKKTDLAGADAMLEGGGKFIFVYYNSALADSERYLSVIKQAGADASVEIYATDAAVENRDGQRWWGGPDGRTDYPTVYFINGGVVTGTEARPQDAGRLERLFEAH